MPEQSGIISGGRDVVPLTRDDLRSELKTFAADTLQPALAEITKQLYWQMHTAGDIDGARRAASATSSWLDGANGVEDHWSLRHTSPMSMESDEDDLRVHGMDPMPTANLRRGPYFGAYRDRRTRSQAHSWLQHRPLTAAFSENVDMGRSLRRQTRKYSESWASYSPMLNEAPTPSPRSEAATEHGQDSMSICAQAEAIVKHTAFEPITGIMVLLNSLVLGFETEFQATHSSGEHLPLPMQILEGISCVVFTSELILRVLAFGLHFFTMEGWMWNVFDMFIVLIQLLDRAMLMLVTFKLPVSVTMFRMLRLIRIVRITRLVKLLNLFEELRTILTSMLQSLGALGWAFLLLILVIYTFSVLFMQILIEMRKFHDDDDDRLQYWFGSLTRTILTMYEAILGGVSWDEVVTPLMESVGPVMGVVFCTYIALSLFAMMNLATGIFVDKAIMVAREDKDFSLATSMTSLFFGEHGKEQPITEEVFQEKLASNVMQEFMKSIDIDSKEGDKLFSLLDLDCTGTLDPRELVSGILRLRGPAKALDLAVITNEISRMRSQHHAIETRLERMCEVLERGGGSSAGTASFAKRGSASQSSGELGALNT